MDRTELREYNPTHYQVTKASNFVRPLGSMGKNWNIYNNSTQLQHYYPQVVINRYPNPKISIAITQALELDFSAPKVLYDNNLYELRDKDFGNVCQALSQKLGIMGVAITPQVIANMDVKSIEYGKNMLTRNIPAEYILHELYRARIPHNNFLNVSYTTYHNGGTKVAFFCKEYDVIFYDKTLEVLHELEQNPTILPPNVAQVLQKGTSNILRMEVRFKSTQALKDFVVTQHHLTTGTKFCNVFSQAISQYVLTYFWNELSHTARMDLPFVLSPAFELWQIHAHGRRSMSTQKKLAKLGMRCLLREHGYNGAKMALKRVKCSNPATYIRQYAGKKFRPLVMLDIWRYIDGSLRRFSCLDARRWQTFNGQSRGPWFYKKEEALTVQEASKWLNVGEETVRRAIRRKELLAKKTPSGWRIRRGDLLDYLYAEV